jgi:predicted enzyme related to lactoylglutathione lyase
MPNNNITHFDIEADDVARARGFYETVFGWRFEPWGPPDFFLIVTGSDDDPGIHGALHARHAKVEGRGMIGFRCTIGVDDVDATATAIRKGGGTITMPKTTIPGVGTLVEFQDTEGNVACAMTYEREELRSPRPKR